MAESSQREFDTRKFIHSAQAGGIEDYVLNNGPGRGVRALCVNTGGGLRYRVLVDRGLDIDQATHHENSLAYLTHKGVVAPDFAYNRGIDWLKSFTGGLLTTCGPFNLGPPGLDAGEELGLHGHHTNTPAMLESVVQPEPHLGRLEMSIVARCRYGRLFGPSLELKRTIRSVLGLNTIEIKDEFTNPGNVPAPHAWLLHINFGYPLVNTGTELCYNAAKVEPRNAPDSIARFKKLSEAKRVPDALDEHRGTAETFAYFYPRPIDRAGATTVAIVNRKLSLGVAIHYNTKEFPRCGNWQHFGPGEYVTALEPMNGSVDGRWVDREKGIMDSIQPGEGRSYSYKIEVVTDRAKLDALRKLNGP